jgi:hypothetical protein
MENYSYQSYPDSGNSSPRYREINFENPPTGTIGTIPWEDQQQQNQTSYKVKFICSYLLWQNHNQLGKQPSPTTIKTFNMQQQWRRG